MTNNRYWTPIFTAAIGNLRSASALAQHDPWVRGGFANPAREKATGDKRNLYPLAAWALAAMFALAGSAATAQSPLTGQNAEELRRLLAVPAENVIVDCSFNKPPRHPVSAFDRFLMWNEISLDTTAIDHTPDPAHPSCFGEQIGPTRSSRALAIVHIAMFDAENAITQKYVSYSGVPAVSGNVSLDFAIAQAAHDTLVAEYPGQKSRLDSIFDLDKVTIPGTPAALAAGEALGKQAAAAILAKRVGDNSTLPEPTYCVDFIPIGGCPPNNVPAGVWSPDPISKLTIALGGNWPKVTPFVLTSADQFRAPPPPPPSLTNAEYKSAFNEAFTLGGDPAHGTNTSRTPFETFMGLFWAYDATPGLCAPPRLYNMVTRTIALQQKMLTVPEIARLFALVNVALADAAISAWDTKYFYQVWRPVTAIRAQRDPTFYPLGSPDTNAAGPNFTPPFPSYVSGHGTIGGSLFQVLRNFWPDATPFTFISDEWNGKNKDINGNIMPLRPAHYDLFTQAEYDNGESRIYLGIHWQYDADQGIIEGNKVGEYVFNHAFRPAQ